MKTSKNINISIVLGIIACIITVAFRLFSEADLWFQMFSAILGVIITIIITNLLLNSQFCANEMPRYLKRNSEFIRIFYKHSIPFLKKKLSP